MVRKDFTCELCRMGPKGQPVNCALCRFSGGFMVPIALEEKSEEGAGSKYAFLILLIL